MSLDDRKHEGNKENSSSPDKENSILKSHLGEAVGMLENFNETLEGYLILDSEAIITHIDSILCQQLNCEQGEYLGNNFNTLVPDISESLLAEFAKNPTSGQAYTHEIDLETKSGKQLKFLLKAAPIYSDGKYLGTLCLFSNRTLERQNIDYLQTSVQYHELMVKYLPLGLLILNDKGNIINMNPAFENITGFKQKDLLYKSVFFIEFISDLKYRYTIDKLLLYQIDFDFETSEIKINNHSVFFRMRGFHLITKSERIYYLLVFGDISSRKKQDIAIRKKMDELIKLENHLQETISMKEKELQEKEWQLLEQTRQETNRTLLAKIAHYWRQPLNNATILIQSLQDDYEFGELNSERFNSKVNRAVFQLNELSNTLETFKYLSYDDSAKSEFLIKDVIEKAVSLLSPSCQSANIKVSAKYMHNLAAIGYPRRFAQVIINIMENAMEIHQEKKTEAPYIEIKLDYEDKKAVIVISDNAGGIGADLATRIFDPYFTTRERKSLGLGLYLALKVVREMFGGNIEYIRTIDGSNFKIIFPAKIK